MFNYVVYPGHTNTISFGKKFPVTTTALSMELTLSCVVEGVVVSFEDGSENSMGEGG